MGLIYRANRALKWAHAQRGHLYRAWPTHFPVHCPICGARYRVFETFGDVVVRANARCPTCHSVERHRLLWLALHRRAAIGRGPLRLLHFAPESWLAHRFRRMEDLCYLSADLAAHRRPSLMTDITALSLRDASVDAIICSHVLEHVPNDYDAMRECWRVLKPRGWLAVQVPTSDQPTDEDLSVTDPSERVRRFRQADHVRLYGPDLADRLHSVGFDVSVLHPRDVLTPSDGDVGIPDSEGPIFWCHRRDS